MKILIMLLTVFFITACASLSDSKEKAELFEEKFVGEHSALASCVANKLQSDGRSFMRALQFRNRQYPDMQASEIHAYDTRYLHNAYSTYAPSNPDAILIYGNPAPEILSAAQRGENDKSVYAFALLLQKIDDTTVNASLKGDSFMGNIAWKILQACAASAAKTLVS
ncbi:hypothetical protein [Nitrosomonas sp.]|uniref:hypothetical protein n=1 Tax=Nitrosomonas sp. TaxID=42353 RepID=UPI0025EAB5E0|nr:hypothetical protein [Nitrosomonas sp.]MBY0483816.1 hypothetical protein [Nitrosomonas sp.]